MRITAAICILLGSFVSACARSGDAEGALTGASASAGSAPVPETLAEADLPHMIAGGFSRGRGPDGNTVIYAAPDGLVVIDTGRHPGHSQEILDYAASRGVPITTIVNTHWHLDHSTGNQDIKAVYPDAKVYTTRAVESALDGFLARGLEQTAALLNDPKRTDAERAELERGRKTVMDRVGLLPDVVVDGPMRLPVNGRDLELEVTDRAVTESDVWVWDPATRTVVAGDLVVIPAPFFDTACPAGWSRALASLADKPFEALIPGHGEAMTRAEFDIYRAAFDDVLACAASDASPADCGARWVEGAGALLDDDEKKAAPQYIEYYVDAILRSAEARAEYCGA